MASFVFQISAPFWNLTLLLSLIIVTEGADSLRADAVLKRKEMVSFHGAEFDRGDRLVTECGAGHSAAAGQYLPGLL